MVSKQSVDEQLRKLGFNQHGWGRAEIKELPHILLPGEEIYELVNGIYEGGFALVIATDIRLLLVDRKPMNYLTVEDIRFDMISEIDYSHRVFGAHINISTGYKDLTFRSYNQPRLRKLIGHVQHCMAEAKKQQSQNQVGQNQNLERINEQLQTYLKAQSEYQIELHRTHEAQRAGAQDVEEPTKPSLSHELSDYLFARSLLSHYEAQTGKRLQLEDEHKIQAIPGEAASVGHSTQLHELWSSGVAEVFGKYKQLASQAKDQSSTTKPYHTFEVNPVSVVFSKLPMLIRGRRFVQPIQGLSSDNAVS